MSNGTHHLEHPFLSHELRINWGSAVFPVFLDVRRCHVLNSPIENELPQWKCEQLRLLLRRRYSPRCAGSNDLPYGCYNSSRVHDMNDWNSIYLESIYFLLTFLMTKTYSSVISLTIAQTFSGSRARMVMMKLVRNTWTRQQELLKITLFDRHATFRPPL